MTFQVKDELGWADFQVRSATAIRRHQTLVHCAFSFCWNTWFDPPSTNDNAASSPEPSHWSAPKFPDRGSNMISVWNGDVHGTAEADLFAGVPR